MNEDEVQSRVPWLETKCYRRGRAPQPWRWRFLRNVNIRERRLEDKWREVQRTINSSYNPAMIFDSSSHQLLQLTSQPKLQCSTSWNSSISILVNWNKSCPVSPSFNIIGSRLVESQHIFQRKACKSAFPTSSTNKSLRSLDFTIWNGFLTPKLSNSIALASRHHFSSP